MTPVRTALFIVLTDHAGGAEQVASMLANALARRQGWTVQYRVLAARADPSFSMSRLSEVVELGFGSGGSPLPGLVTAPAWMGRQQFDLVFTTHLYTNALSALARRIGILRTRRLVTRESTTIFDRFRGLKRWLAQALYRTYGTQDLAVVQTGYMGSHVAERVSERARARLTTLGNPLDLAAIDEKAACQLPDAIRDRLVDRMNILMCGSLIEVKQPLLAVDTFSRLLERSGRDLQLVFVGDGPLRAEVEAAVQARGLSDQVVFLGRQANPYPIMRACQYGLLTSSREGFPNVVLEMMACGMRKVVMTPCAGDLETLTGVTVTEGFSADELAAALGDAIANGDDLKDTYRQVVATRSVERYLDAVLGGDADAH